MRHDHVIDRCVSYALLSNSVRKRISYPRLLALLAAGTGRARPARPRYTHQSTTNHPFSLFSLSLSTRRAQIPTPKISANLFVASSSQRADLLCVRVKHIYEVYDVERERAERQRGKATAPGKPTARKQTQHAPFLLSPVLLK